MSRFYINANFAGQPAEGLVELLNQTLQNIEDIHNAGPDLISIIGQQRVPVGLVDGDVVASLQNNVASISISSNGQLIPILPSGYQGDTISGGVASLTQYPNNGDWGFHTDTAGGTYKLAKNLAGVIKSVALT